MINDYESIDDAERVVSVTIIWHDCLWHLLSHYHDFVIWVYNDRGFKLSITQFPSIQSTLIAYHTLYHTSGDSKSTRGRRPPFQSRQSVASLMSYLYRHVSYAKITSSKKSWLPKALFGAPGGSPTSLSGRVAVSSLAKASMWPHRCVFMAS